VIAATNFGYCLLGTLPHGYPFSGGPGKRPASGYRSIRYFSDDERWKGCGRAPVHSTRTEKVCRVTVDDTELNVPETTDIYATIHYRFLSKDGTEFARLVSDAKTSGCKYVVISTGNDVQNVAFARQAASLFGRGALVSYIQNRRPQEVIDSKAAVFAFGYQKNKAAPDQLETIAYNLHYSYKKAENYRVSNRVIRDTFNEDYYYVSNLGAAIHIREKLQCCGIDTSDNSAAAEKFAELMKDDPSVVDLLAALEHRRWMVEKILNGFIQIPSLERIYSGPGVTTHDSKGRKG